jgi:hypothetical protein
MPEGKAQQVPKAHQLPK